jgi:hypothetical protein
MDYLSLSVFPVFSPDFFGGVHNIVRLIANAEFGMRNAELGSALARRKKRYALVIGSLSQAPVTVGFSRVKY